MGWWASNPSLTHNQAWYNSPFARHFINFRNQIVHGSGSEGGREGEEGERGEKGRGGGQDTIYHC